MSEPDKAPLGVEVRWEPQDDVELAVMNSIRQLLEQNIEVGRLNAYSVNNIVVWFSSRYWTELPIDRQDEVLV